MYFSPFNAFHAFPHLSLFVAWTGIVASQIHLGVSDYLIIAGAIGFAYSSLRQGRMRVLRETNIDLTDRNKLLVTKLEELGVDEAKMAAQILTLEQRPSLESHERLLHRQLELLEGMQAQLEVIQSAVVQPS